MCDSICIEVLLDTMTEAGYTEGQYPFRNMTDTDKSWVEFRELEAKSPLTGAGFKVTPIGELIPGAGDKRVKWGQIAGYQVDVNVPACLIGHNRLLVNGVPQAARAAYCLLQYWLARNGCTQAGLGRIDFANIELVDLTVTPLYLLGSEALAREALREFRVRSETLLNKKRKDGDKRRKVAYSSPPEPLPDSTAEYTYTSYVRLREFLLSAYVKELNQPNAFLLPLADESLEAEVRALTARILRGGIQVHRKWLRDNDLHLVAAWKDKSEPYEKVFGLLRQTLKLDKVLRAQRMKRTTVAKLTLSDTDKMLLIYHLDRNVVREHPHFRDMDSEKRNTYYSASKQRVYEQTGIDFNVSYDEQMKVLSSRLSELLVYPGEFKPANHLAGYVFSRVSVPVALRKLEAIVAGVLEYGPDRVPPLPKHTVYNGPQRMRGIH